MFPTYQQQLDSLLCQCVFKTGSILSHRLQDSDCPGYYMHDESTWGEQNLQRKTLFTQLDG